MDKTWESFLNMVAHTWTRVYTLYTNFDIWKCLEASDGNDDDKFLIK
jgi:hypothetical protein